MKHLVFVNDILEDFRCGAAQLHGASDRSDVELAVSTADSFLAVGQESAERNVAEQQIFR